MKKLVDHSVASSLKEHLQYRTWVDLDACRMESGKFYQYQDEKLPGYFVYGSPYAPWVYDQTVSGVNIPTSFGGYTRSQMNIDFQNGRLISSGALPNLTGTYGFPVSEVSFFVSSIPEWTLLDETQYGEIPYMEPATGYAPPYSYNTPCVFVKSQNTENEILCLGGEYWTVWNFRTTVITKDEYELNALQKVIRDTKGTIFTILPQTPFNPIGDLKSGVWNYPSFYNSNYYAFIEDSTFKILEPDIFTKNHNGLFMGLGNIEVRVPRTPTIHGSDP